MPTKLEGSGLIPEGNKIFRKIEAFQAWDKYCTLMRYKELGNNSSTDAELANSSSTGAWWFFMNIPWAHEPLIVKETYNQLNNLDYEQ